MLNKVMLIGNLGRDPEMRSTNSGKQVASFSVGVTERDKTEWFNCIAWEKTAQLVGQYLTKGQKVFVEGRLQSSQYEHQGQTRHKTEVIVTNVVFLSPKSEKQASNGQNYGDFGQDANYGKSGGQDFGNYQSHDQLPF